ncbi:MAG: CoA transferase [Rhodospirillaceae bacterium]
MSFSFLDGIRVLDLSQFLPGPLAGQILADLGADVVKVEPPQGDPLLSQDPVSGLHGSHGGDALSPFNTVLNAGKRVVRLDLKSADGQAAFRDMIQSVDVVVESFRPGVIDRLGFGFDAARAMNPSLIYCSHAGYGQTGPKRTAAGHDLNYMAFSGALSQAGDANGPTIAWPPMVDCAGAVVSPLSIRGALVRGGRTGEGTYLDVAMADCVLSWQALGLTADRLNGPHGRGQGLLTGGAAFYRAYKTKDGRYLTVGALEAPLWRNFCQALGREDRTGRQ